MKKVTETVECGDFSAEITTEDGQVTSMFILGKTQGRGRNQLIVKNRWEIDLSLFDLQDLVDTLWNKYHQEGSD